MMKLHSLPQAKRTVALFIFMTAVAAPLCSQELKDTTDELAATPPVVSAQAPAKPSAKQNFVFPTRLERFNRYVKSTVGPSSLVKSAITAGIDQWRDHPEEWQQGTKGYGKRYASDFGRNAIQQTVVFGLDSALGLDTKFRRSTRKGFVPRIVDALAENVTSRNKSGGRVISVPRITGIYTAQVIKYEAWFPERFSYKHGLRGGTRSLAIGFGINVLREFVLPF